MALSAGSLFVLETPAVDASMWCRPKKDRARDWKSALIERATQCLQNGFIAIEARRNLSHVTTLRVKIAFHPSKQTLIPARAGTYRFTGQFCSKRWRPSVLRSWPAPTRPRKPAAYRRSGPAKLHEKMRKKPSLFDRALSREVEFPRWFIASVPARALCRTGQTWTVQSRPRTLQCQVLRHNRCPTWAKAAVPLSVATGVGAVPSPVHCGGQIRVLWLVQEV